ncbi:unnamed protein product [Phytomonas sp. EM1]|nr:unnamed protein product [Phytomonas sp. EM1]|eukprot:CCW61873.1 unnamed protein product [Phytomonas sp. isolate EM1]
MATLKVTVHEARDLPVMDRGTGLADPYVVLKLDDMEHTTDIVRHTRHPVWNLDYRFDTPDLLILQEDPLVVRVYDHDIISRDNLVGTVLLDCNCILGLENPFLTGWFPLHDTIEGLRGDIRLTIRIKFHAAENPLRPVLPERYVYRVHLAPMEPDATAGELSRGPSDGKKRAEQDALLNKIAKPEASPSGTIKVPPVGAIGGSPMVNPIPTRIRSTKRHFSNGWCRAKGKPPLLFLGQSLSPLMTTQSLHPTLAAEEEGVYIFGAWRLDPAVYRIESIHSMVEELIVKADPEHSRLTNLRSIRTTNEARLIQLFKLSGKVRRQLARKVVEMRCNAVLGYVEEFDIELKDIIVRAYGTPCVISATTFVDESNLQNVRAVWKSPTGRISPSQAIGTAAAEPGGFSPLQLLRMSPDEAAATSGTPPLMLPKTSYTATAEASMVSPDIIPKDIDESAPKEVGNEQSKSFRINTKGGAIPLLAATLKSPFLSIAAPPASSNGGTPIPALPTAQSKSNLTESLSHSGPTIAATRTAITILTVKDLPSGCILRISGHICSRSVKIISRGKSKQAISQERDAWWMELREELRTNARAFHCNAILGYKEETQCYEDVVLLSLFGTAVVLDPSFVSLRAEHTHLFYKACERLEGRKSCSMLHRYHGPHGKVMNFKRNVPKHHFHSMFCRTCSRKLVPEVILASCSLPVDLITTGPLRLVQATVVKSKRDVRGVQLAMEVSQALPYIEFALHKQLLFNLRLLRMNACFGLCVSIVIGPQCIIGILTGTGCQLAALPIPILPCVTVSNSMIAGNDRVIRLKDLIAKNRRMHHAKGINCKKEQQRHRHHHRGGGGRRRGNSSSSSSSISTSSGERAGSRGSTSSPKSGRSYSLTTPSYSSVSLSKNHCSPHSSLSSRPLLPLLLVKNKHHDSGSTSDASTFSSTMGSSTEREMFCIEGSDSDSNDTEDLHRPAAEVQALGLAGSRVSDFVVKIDDEDEADMMLGMDRMTTFEDSLLLTVPYLPEQVNWFDTQEYVTVHRRYAIEELNTRRLNECCADAKRAFVVATGCLTWREGTSHMAYHAHPSAAKGGGKEIRDLVHRLSGGIVRVFEFKIGFLFEPNLGDLHLHLEGCVLTNQAARMTGDKGGSAWWGRLLRLEDQAFRECLRHSNLGFSCESDDQQEKGRGARTVDSALATPALRSLSAVAVDCSRMSIALDDFSDRFITATDPSIAHDHEVSPQRMLPSGFKVAPVADFTTIVTDGRCHQTDRRPTNDPLSIDRTRLLYTLYRQLFASCNAPFSLTYMLNSYRFEVPPLRVWAPGAKDNPTAGGLPATGSSDGVENPHNKNTITTYTDYRKRKPTRSNTVIGRWQSLWSATKSSLHSMIERTKQAANLSNSYSGDYHNFKASRFVGSHKAKGHRGGAKVDASEAHYHKPTERLPPELDALDELIFTVHCTPLDFVPGKVVVRYLGRLSQHFIRQANDIYRGAQLGSFYHHVEFEIRCLVQSLVGVMGGNAILKYRIVYHEMNDSDGSCSAFVFFSVTGDVVHVIPATDLINGVDEKDISAGEFAGDDTAVVPPVHTEREERKDSRSL